MAERPWTDEILEKIPSGVAVLQIEERLRLTPTQRLVEALSGQHVDYGSTRRNFWSDRISRGGVSCRPCWVHDTSAT